MFWIVDNGSDHRSKASIKRLQGRWPTLILVHLPVHASWLNQVEIYHSIIQRKLLAPNDVGVDLPRFGGQGLMRDLEKALGPRPDLDKALGPRRNLENALGARPDIEKADW